MEEWCTSEIPRHTKQKLSQIWSWEERCSNQIPRSTPYIQKEKKWKKRSEIKSNLEREERCSNQIPLDSTTYRKSNYIQKVSGRNGAQTRYLSTRLHTESQIKLEERCSNQIPLDSITYRKSAGGTVLKPDTSRLDYIQKVKLHTESQRGGTVLKPRYLSTRLHTESQIKLEDGGQTHTSTTLQTLKLGGINVQ